MARWKLLAAHYLTVEDCFWEQVETDRETGRQRRKQYPVPMHLDPKNPNDCNYRPNTGNVMTGGNSEEIGSIVVCYKGKGERRDYVFIGEPTAEMEPLDDEAKAISDRIRETGRWDWASAGIETRSPHELRLDQAVEALGATAGKDYNAEFLTMQKQMMEMMAMMNKTLAEVANISAGSRRI